jgi:ubiquinone biosynthesis protein
MKRLRMIKTGIELGIRVSRKQKPKEIGQWFRREMEDLGVFSQKMGQWISSRDDIFHPDFVNELKSLQNAIRPMDEKDASALVENIVGLASMDRVPLATGTIGQVHRGITADGTVVAIKLKKPGVERCLEDDARFVMSIASFVSRMGIQEAKQAEEITRSFMEDVILETDFEKEVSNMAMFRKDAVDAAVIPKVFEAMCDENVIVMEFVESTNIVETTAVMSQDQKKDLAIRLMLLFTNQLLTGNIVHTDPHQGNYGMMKDGSIVLYDYGNVVRMDDDFRYNIKQLIVCMISGNANEAIRIMKDDMRLVITDEKELEEWLKLYFEYIKTPGLDAKAAFANSSAKTAAPVIFTRDIVKLVKAFSSLEGTCVGISEDFNYFLMIPEFAEMLLMDRDFLEKKIVRDASRLLSTSLSFFL